MLFCCIAVKTFEGTCNLKLLSFYQNIFPRQSRTVLTSLFFNESNVLKKRATSHASMVRDGSYTSFLLFQ